MKTEIFDYPLPENLIAYYPLEKRDYSRLLIVDRQTQSFVDKCFSDIIDEINPEDVLILNNSKVMRARLFGYKQTGAKLEFLIEKILDNQTFLTHIRANHAPKIGAEISIAGHSATILDKKNGLYRLTVANTSIWELMEDFGHIPLPPYIKRQDESIDNDRYQTVYSQVLGSVAAPTAGLHFTHDMLKKIKRKGTKIAYVTLHVGAGTFKPVSVADIEQHKMHSEWLSVSDTTCQIINETKTRKGRVIAVGTTSVRALETAAATGKIKPFLGESNIFFYPGQSFHIVDAMITNFHLPKSTLMMLVSAFSSVELMQNAYRYAIESGYRFYSYGDAMLIK